MPESAKKKISAYQKGRPKSEEQRQKHIERIYATQAKRVVVYTQDMKVVAEYPSAAEAARNTNYSHSAVAKQCRNCSGLIKPNKKDKLIFRYKDIVCPT